MDTELKTKRVKETRPYTAGGHYSGATQTRVRDIVIAESASLPDNAVEVAADAPCHEWQIEEAK